MSRRVAVTAYASSRQVTFALSSLSTTVLVSACRAINLSATIYSVMFKCTFNICTRILHSRSEVTNMRPTKHSGKASSCMVRIGFYYFRLLFVSVDIQFCSSFNRFQSMTKKLCGPLAQR